MLADWFEETFEFQVYTFTVNALGRFDHGMTAHYVASRQMITALGILCRCAAWARIGLTLRVEPGSHASSLLWPLV